MSSVKQFVSLKEKNDRVVVLIDMDCFYCQVEEFENESKLAGKPLAVVQYLENAGIIAVNYAARSLGVTRHMREKEAKAVCSDLICVKVPSKNGKADLTKYRDAGLQVAKVLQTFTPLLERASVDEAYLDITENVSIKMQEMRENKFQLQPTSFSNTYAVGYENFGQFVMDVTSSVDKNFEDVPDDDRKAVASSKLRLLVGAAIVNDIRKAVKDQTRYECSAGIAHNKILAKLTCGMNKPNKQTVLPIESVSGLFDNLAINKVKNLGGKLGEEVCEKLNVKTMADLLRFTEGELQNHFQARVGTWLYYMARGIDLEKVTPKFLSKSIAVSKNFRGKNEISSVLTLKFWLKELSKEIVERLEKDTIESNRSAKHMIVTFTQGEPKTDTNNVSSTRTVPLNGNSLNSYIAEQIADEAFETIKKNSKQFLKAEGTVVMFQSIKHLGISASKFADNSAPSTSSNLQSLLKNHKKTETKSSPSNSRDKKESKPLKASIKKFEMKSPKSMFIKGSKPSETKIGGQENDSTTSLTVQMSFTGDFAIKGIKNLTHWINQIFDQLCVKLNDFGTSHNQSPMNIQLKFEYWSQNQKKTKDILVPLNKFVDNIISIDLLVELMLKSDEFLREDSSLIQLPITRIAVIPSNFQNDEKWSYIVKNLRNTSIITNEDDLMENVAEAENLIGMNEEVDESVNETKSIEETSSVGSPAYDFSDDSEDVKKMDELLLNFSESEDVEMETNDVIKEIPMDASEASETSQTIPNFSQFQPKELPINDYMEMLNPKEECQQCGKMIGRLDMIAHADHHLALQIASEQREEYRKQLKTNRPAAPTQRSAKKTQKSKQVTKKTNLNSIFKYAVKTDQTTNEEPNEGKVKCSECLKYFSPEELISHLDYHFAKKIRDEELKRVSPKVEVRKKKPSSSKKSNVNSVKSYFTNTD